MKLHNDNFKIAGEVAVLNFTKKKKKRTKKGKISTKVKNKILSSFSYPGKISEYLNQGTNVCFQISFFVTGEEKRKKENLWDQQRVGFGKHKC